MQHTPISLLGQRPYQTAREPIEAALAAAARVPAPARSLYIHIPFCFHKCHYCDFYSIVDRQDRQDAFTNRLIEELTALAPAAGGLPLRTIFVGGGTPTLLAPHLWQRLLTALSSAYQIDNTTEFSVECNPETATTDLFDTLVAGGVNRLSIGAQSFNPAHLRTLERWHDPDNVGKAIRLAAAAGIERTSVDLIFAIPGQSPDDWRADLRTAIDLGTTHVSAYNLTYEPGTAMTARLDRGAVTPADEQTEIAMLDATVDTLAKAGFARYEVSNFAFPGHECRHNLAYWRQEQWLAAGPSASAYVAGARWKNTPRLDTYLTQNDKGFAPINDLEPPDPRRELAEIMMTGLRLAEGIDAARFRNRAACLEAKANGRLAGVLDQAARAGHLDDPAGWMADRWRLTRAGLMLADGIAADAINAIADPVEQHG